MALTYRTGSGGKGSALTIEELDNNFRHFTGSHDVSGSFTVSGSTTVIGDTTISGSLSITGSNTFTNFGPFEQSGGPVSISVANSNGAKLISVTGSFHTTASIADGQTTIFNQGAITNTTDFRIMGLPTSDPSVAGRLWRDGTDLKISVG